MTNIFREFQVFIKPVGSNCNLDCHYCYYLGKTETLYPDCGFTRMDDSVLEQYIIQHIEASTEKLISFSWHGGEPLLAGIDFYKKAVEIQKRNCNAGQQITNGIQTNGTLINDEWSAFLKKEKFVVGISLDGTPELHNQYRVYKDGRPSFDLAMKGYQLLQEYGVICEILCVVNSTNVHHSLKVYEFFKELEAQYISFLPLVDRSSGSDRVSPESVGAEDFGLFLVNIFNEWKENDIGRIKIQIFEEALRTSFGQDHTLCIFKETCGGVPVIEQNGDLYSCDHFVNRNYYLGNIKEIPFLKMLESNEQKNFGEAKLDTLPQYCINCEVREMCNGGCPKNRLLVTPDGEQGLNYLCAGYKYFFNHCRPFVTAVAKAWHQKSSSN